MERLKKKAIVELAKKLEMDNQFVSEIVDIIYNNGEPEDIPLTIEMLEKHFEWVKKEEITTTEQYQDIMDEVKRQNEMITSLDKNDVSSEEMRKKLGYNKNDWKKITSLETVMVNELKKLILEYMSINIMIPEALNIDTATDSHSFIAINGRWKAFARNYLIPNYPGATDVKKGKSMRMRLIGLFETKLLAALK